MRELLSNYFTIHCRKVNVTLGTDLPKITKKTDLKPLKTPKKKEKKKEDFPPHPL